MRRVVDWIKKAYVSLLTEDTGNLPVVQVTHNDVSTDALLFQPLGLYSQPALDHLALLVAPNGRPNDPVALVADPVGRFTGLEAGEVVVGNSTTRTHVKFAASVDMEVTVGENGSLVVSIPSGDATITIVGDVTVDVTGDVTMDVTGDVDLTAANVNIVGDVDITGTLGVSGVVTGAGDIRAGAGSVGLLTHVHGGVTAGGANTATGAG